MNDTNHDGRRKSQIIYNRDKQSIISMSFDPTQPRLVTASNESYIKVLYYRQDNTIKKINVNSRVNASCVAFSSRGLLAVGMFNGEVNLFDHNLELIETLKISRYAICAITFSGDGRYFAIGCNDGAIAIWEMRLRWNMSNYMSSLGSFYKSINEHLGAIQNLSMNYDGGYLFSISIDRTLRLWNCSTGNSISISREHKDLISDITLMKDERMYITSSRDGTVRVWKSPEEIICANIPKETPIHLVSALVERGISEDDARDILQDPTSDLKHIYAQIRYFDKLIQNNDPGLEEKLEHYGSLSSLLAAMIYEKWAVHE